MLTALSNRALSACRPRWACAVSPQKSPGSLDFFRCSPALCALPASSSPNLLCLTIYLWFFITQPKCLVTEGTGVSYLEPFPLNLNLHPVTISYRNARPCCSHTTNSQIMLPCFSPDTFPNCDCLGEPLRRLGGHSCLVHTYTPFPWFNSCRSLKME